MSFLPVFAAVTVTIAAAAAPTAYAADSAHPAAPATDVRSTRVRLSTGVALHVTERGAPDGEPVLFLHGYTDSWFSFSTVLDRLPLTIRAIVPSQRGHGDSERPECCYRPADFAADAVALLDALGVKRATVVGHSMGSFVAQRVAIDAPGRVTRLVLVGSGATVRTPPVLDFQQSVRKLTDPISPAFVRDFQHSGIARPVPAAFMNRVVSESEKLPARLWRDVLDRLIADERKSSRTHRDRDADRVGRQGRTVFLRRPDRAGRCHPRFTAGDLRGRWTLAAVGGARALHE